MRPRPITGPLILILLGLAFLLNNLRPDLFRWGLLGDYWPFLLIAFGLIGLIEALVQASRGQNAAPRTGGGWIYWILVPIILIAAVDHRGQFTSFDRPRFAVFGTDWDYDVNLSSDAAGVKHIVLDGLPGNLSLRGDGEGQVRITGKKSVRAMSHDAAERADKESPIRIERHGDTTLIRAAIGAARESAQISGDLEIMIPKGLSVESKGRQGDLTIDDIDGTVDVAAGRGDVRLSHIGGDVHVASSRGGLFHASELKSGLTLQGRGNDIELITIAGPVTINGEYSGALEFRALAGPLRFTSARTEFRAEAIPGTVSMDLSDLRLNNVSGPVHFQTGSRDVYVTDVTDALELQLDRGDVEITASHAPLPKIDVHSRVGDVELTLPDQAPFDLDATTGQGDVVNQFGGGLQTQTDGRRGTVRGKTGNGPQISIATGRGDVSVRKG